jgi:uncharacterized protein (TIGR03382 family)
VTFRNTGTTSLTAATMQVTANIPAVSFPSGNSLAAPTTAPFSRGTVRFPIALAQVTGTQSAQFTVTITDTALAAGPVTQTIPFRLNFDVKENNSTLDDVESPMSKWTPGSDPQLNTGSNFRIFQASADEHFWFGPNPSSPADTYLTSPELKVGTDPLTVSFKHRYDFEFTLAPQAEYFDGAVVEVSTDGTTWVDVGASSSPGYTNSITADPRSSNPLRGRRGFVGLSTGYPAFITETITLGTAYANQNLRFRFRIGSDDAAAEKGWEIDDIQFTGITNLPFSNVVADVCGAVAPVGGGTGSSDGEPRGTGGGTGTDGTPEGTGGGTGTDGAGGGLGFTGNASGCGCTEVPGSAVWFALTAFMALRRRRSA